MTAPKPSSVWRHWKRDSRYRIVGIGVFCCSSTDCGELTNGSLCVVYHEVGYSLKLYVRPLDEWHDRVTTTPGDTAGISCVQRFVRDET